MRVICRAGKWTEITVYCLKSTYLNVIYENTFNGSSMFDPF